jgi:hypothetical protein
MFGHLWPVAGAAACIEPYPHPHRFRAPPDIRHNRHPASGIGFTEPNLAILCEEIAHLSLPSA